LGPLIMQPLPVSKHPLPGRSASTDSQRTVRSTSRHPPSVQRVAVAHSVPNPRPLKPGMCSSATLVQGEQRHSPKSSRHAPVPLIHRSCLQSPRENSPAAPKLNAPMVGSYGFGQAFNAHQIQHIKALITSEFQISRQALIAEQQVAMKNFMTAFEARFEANVRECSKPVNQIGDIEACLHRMDAGLKSTILRLDSLAARQMSRDTEYQQFQHEALAFFEHLTESLDALNQEQCSMELRLASILPVNQPVARTEQPHRCGSAEHDPNNSGQKGALSNSLWLATSAAGSERFEPQSTIFHGISSEAPQREESPQAHTDTAPSPEMPAEKSMRVKALAMALTSMDQQEQERIRCFQDQIQELQRMHETFKSSRPANDTMT